MDVAYTMREEPRGLGQTGTPALGVYKEAAARGATAWRCLKGRWTRLRLCAAQRHRLVIRFLFPLTGSVLQPKSHIVNTLNSSFSFGFM